MQHQLVVAACAECLADDLAAGSDFGAVDGEVEDLVEADVADDGGIHGVRIDGDVPVAFDADGIAAGRGRGKRGGEGVDELAAGERRLADVLGDIAVVVRGRSGHDQVQEVQLG